MNDKNETTPTRAEFVQAVRAFKRAHQGKLKNLLNKTANPETVQAFFANPIIYAYLARASIVFLDKHPDLSDSKTKEEHDNTDHYELKIYKYLPDMIAYRKESITSPQFYELGTYSTLNPFFLTLLQNLIKTSSDIVIKMDHPEQAAREMINLIFNKPDHKPYRFRIDALTVSLKHATTSLSILDPITHRVLVTLFIDSGDQSSGKGFIKQTENDFLKRYRFKNYMLNRAAIKNYLTTLVSIDINDPALLPPDQREHILLNKTEKAACVLNSTIDRGRDVKDAQSEELMVLENSPDIETIFHISTEPCIISEEMSMIVNPNVSFTRALHMPFIDASHSLQDNRPRVTETFKELPAEDQNCSLYSFNFINAIVTLLNQSGMADHVFQLAEAASQNNQDSIASLVKIFREDLKIYLPCYYDPVTHLSKSPEELRNFHLQQRWEMGAKSLSVRYPLKQTNTTTVTSPLTTISAKQQQQQAFNAQKTLKDKLPKSESDKEDDVTGLGFK